MIITVLEVLCFVIPGTIFIIVAIKISKNELYLTSNSLMTPLALYYYFEFLRELQIYSLISIIFSIVVALVISYVISKLVGYNFTIHSDEIDKLSNVLIDILNRKKITFNIKENDEDNEIIFKFNNCIFKKIIIQMYIGRLDDKIKSLTLCFKQMNRRETLKFIEDIVEYFNNKQIFKAKRIDFILCIIFALIEYGLAMFILVKNL